MEVAYVAAAQADRVKESAPERLFVGFPTAKTMEKVHSGGD